MAKVSRESRRRRSPAATPRPGAGPGTAPPGSSVDAPLPEPLLGQQASLHTALLGWFARVARDLPWRRGHDPYGTWISEVMLQQTQVDRVVDYFHRFMERFPTVERLAAAPEAEVLRAWEGLGYYRRARQLHAAARRIVADHGGLVPDTVTALRGLPGIGRYTAGAIASIAFDHPEPVVEANSRRVLARLTAHAEPLDGTAGDAPIWAIASALVPPRRAGLWNQALMDLGATTCTPRAPICSACPLASHCLALATGRVGSIPVSTPRPPAVAVEETAVVVRRGSSVLVIRRGPGEWWEGLWDFPRLPATAILAPLGCGRRRVVGRSAYTVTHHRVDVKITVCEARRKGPRREGVEWVDWQTLATLAVTTPGRRIAAIAARSQRPPRGRPATKTPRRGRD